MDRRMDRRTEAIAISLSLFLKSVGINISDFTDVHNEKIQILCNRCRFSYCNLCKCLPKKNK